MGWAHCWLGRIAEWVRTVIPSSRFVRTVFDLARDLWSPWHFDPCSRSMDLIFFGGGTNPCLRRGVTLVGCDVGWMLKPETTLANNKQTFFIHQKPKYLKRDSIAIKGLRYGRGGGVE